MKKYNGVNVLEGVSTTLLEQVNLHYQNVAGDVKPDGGSILFNDSSQYVHKQVALQHQSENSWSEGSFYYADEQ